MGNVVLHNDSRVLLVTSLKIINDWCNGIVVCRYPTKDILELICMDLTEVYNYTSSFLVNIS